MEELNIITWRLTKLEEYMEKMERRFYWITALLIGNLVSIISVLATALLQSKDIL